METKKVRVDTYSNAEDLVMGNSVVIQYYPNIDFPSVEIPSSVTLATLSSENDSGTPLWTLQAH